jgi:hypothetical protein
MCSVSGVLCDLNKLNQFLKNETHRNKAAAAAVAPSSPFPPLPPAFFVVRLATSATGKKRRREGI